MAHNFDSTSSSSLVPPMITKPSKVDLEARNVDQIQRRICLETNGRDFIAPCKCRGTSKYVHRGCLDQWRAVKITASLGFLVYVIDKHQMFWLHVHWGFGSELSFYYICGALLFLALMGISGCFLSCFDESVHDDLGQTNVFCLLFDFHYLLPDHSNLNTAVFVHLVFLLRFFKETSNKA